MQKQWKLQITDFGDLPTVLAGNSAIFIADVANAPGKIIKDFRKKSDKPVFKGAYINSVKFTLETTNWMPWQLSNLRRVIGEIIGLLAISSTKSYFCFAKPIRW